MLSRWVGRHFTANGVRADSAVCASLIEYCGTDMYRLAAETDKISWYVLSHGRDTVEPEDIKPVAVADTDFDSFAFTNAIMQNDRASALVILSEMKRRRTEPTVIMGEVIRVVCDMLTVRTLSESGATPAEIASKLKIHEYRVKLCLRNGGNTVRQKKVLALCADADEALKRSMQNGYAVIEQLICSL